MQQYSVLLLPNEEEGGYGVLVPALPGCVTQGDTFEEALANAREAIELHLEVMAEDGDPIPEERQRPILASVDVQPKHPGREAS